MNEHKKSNKLTLTNRVMSKLIPGFVILFITCFLVFEVLPDNGIAFVNCNWDWLSFVGNLAGILLACWGVVKTIESSQQSTIDQAIYSAKPLLSISLFSGYDKTLLCKSDGLFYNFYISKREIRKDDSYNYLSHVQPERFSEAFSVLRIKNIGLGAAVNITPKLYKVLEMEENLKKIETDGLKDIYNSVHSDSNSIELTDFSLGNDSSAFFIVFNHKERKGDLAHYILEFKYSDMYGKRYIQKQYLLLHEQGCRPIHISKQIEVGT